MNHAQMQQFSRMFDEIFPVMKEPQPESFELPLDEFKLRLSDGMCFAVLHGKAWFEIGSGGHYWLRTLYIEGFCGGENKTFTSMPNRGMEQLIWQQVNVRAVQEHMPADRQAELGIEVGT